MKQYWVPISKYQEFKVGDSVKRNDGGRSVEGNLWDTEGPIIRIEHWHENKELVIFLVADKGNLDRSTVLRPRQVKKIDKEFNTYQSGQQSLF